MMLVFFIDHSICNPLSECSYSEIKDSLLPVYELSETVEFRRYKLTCHCFNHTNKTVKSCDLKVKFRKLGALSTTEVF